MRTRLLLLLLLVTSVTMLAAPTTSSAYVVSGKKWPGRTITYRSTMPRGFDSSLAQAARTWNTSGARIRLVKARRGARAQVVVRFGPTHGSGGFASIGYQRNAYVHIARGTKVPRRFEDRQTMVRLFTHELGHVLGLGHAHPTNCEIMHPYAVGSTGCRLPPTPDPGFYQCRLLFRDDVRGVVRLYGGRIRLSRIYCLRQPAPPQLRGVVFSGGAASGGPLRARWQRPKGYRAGARIEVSIWDGGRCGSSQIWRYRRAHWTLRPTTTSWTDPSEIYDSERVCVQVQFMNRFQHGARPIRRQMSTAVQVPPAPAITISAEYPDAYSDYAVTTSDGTQLQAMRGNPGACPTTLDPEGTLTYSQIDQTTWTFEGVPVGSSCLSFFAISGNGTSSPPTTVEVTHAARPVG